MLEGTLEGGGLLAALRSIAGESSDGLLAVQGDQDLVSVAFLNGKIVAVDAMNQPMEEALSEVLAARGLVAPQSFSSVVDPVLGTGRLAGDVLLEAELVERGDLLDAVREQVCSQALQLLRWEQGIFSWSADAESPYQRGMDPLSVGELLVRSAEEAGAESPFGVHRIELDDRFEATVSARSFKVLGKDGDWIDEGDGQVWLTSTEQRVLENIDSSQPASHLLLQLGCESFELRYALQMLLERNLISKVEGSDEQPTGNVRGLLGEDGDISELLNAPSGIDAEWTAGLAPAPAVIRSQEPASFQPLDREPSDLDLDRSLLDVEQAEEEYGVEEGTMFGQLGESFRIDPDGASSSTHRPETLARLLSLWAARAMALGLAMVLAFLVFLRADRHSLKFPYFWQARAADQLQGMFWGATVEKIESALEAYHLLYGRYPDDLEILVDLRLLSAASLYDAQGRWLAYSVDGDEYVLRPARSDRILNELATRSGVANDLLLDSRFVVRANQEETPGLRVVE